MVIGSLCFPGRRIVSDSNSLTILVFIGNGGVLLTLVVCKASRNSKTFELRKIKCILDKSRHEAISFRCFWWIHQQACVEAITADTSFKPRVRGKSAVQCWKIYCKIVLHLQTLKCYPKCWKIHFDKIVQLLNQVQLFATPWTTACQASLPITNSWSLLRLMSIESVMPFNHLIFCCPFLLLASIFPNIRVFSNESALRIIGVSPSTSVLRMNTQDWSPFGWISLQSKGLSFHYSPTLTSIHDHWKNHTLD